MITNNFDAEFGRNTGAIIDVVTRGGTNIPWRTRMSLAATTHSARATTSIRRRTGRRILMFATTSAPRWAGQS